MTTRLCTALSLLLLLLPPTLHAAEWKPTKPIEFVVGAAAGGSNDLFARSIAKVMVERKFVDVPVNVVNRAGGSGEIAFAHVAKQVGDPHFFVVVPFNLLTNHIMGRSQLSHQDYTPLALLISEYTTVMVRSDSPITNGKDFVARLVQNPQALSISIGTGIANGPHIALALAMKAGGVDVRKLKTVVFQSGGESNTAVLGGHVDAVSSSAANAVSMAGKLRAVAISSLERQPGALASIPTWREQGIDAYFDNWRGVAAPKGLTPEQTAFWDQVFTRLAQSEEWKKECDRYEWVAAHRRAAAFRTQLDDEYRKVAASLTDLGLVKK